MAKRREDIGPDDAVARVVAGERRVEVTRDGDVIALVVEPETLGGMTVRRAATSGGFAGLPRTTIDEEAQDLLDDLRSDR
jgi:hypothetical protein